MTALPNSLPVSLPGLQIDSPLVSSGAANLRPPTWPPPADYPVVVDGNGHVISRYGDAYWDLSIWLGKAARVSFGSGDTRGRKIDPENAALFRLVVAYWLWGPAAVRSARTLVTKHEQIKPLFATCSDAGISASDLYRFPRVIETVAANFVPSTAYMAVVVLSDLWAAREALGFTILDEAGLKQISNLTGRRESVQTAYIPPRIWSYQVLRLKACLDDYIAHQDQIESCFRFCIDAYARNAGSLRESFGGIKVHRAPFNSANLDHESRGDFAFYGRFRRTAERFGIADLLDRWVNASDASGIKAFSSYLSLITHVGHAYVLNFSLMRADEGALLRANCYSIERDPLGEDVHMIGGITTKTIEDLDAKWIVSPTVRVAIDAMKSVALLRIAAAQHNPNLTLAEEDLVNPILYSWVHEPWGASVIRPGRRKVRDWPAVQKAWPKLFSKAELTVTAQDFEFASRMTFGLDPEIFGVGKVWPLAWHQLRRTGAVNMLASGHVSDASLQYQLKHASRAMTRYYGQNYYRLNSVVDNETRAYYLREMYQALAREFDALKSDSFVSPHGEKRKEQILKPVSEKDHAGMARDAAAGRICYRETFLGGCPKPGDPCSLGGISNISGCMGFGEQKACEFALVDRRKRPVIANLRDGLEVQLRKAEPGSRLQASLQAQIESAERALDVIDKV